MSNIQERRKRQRIELTTVTEMFRMCDIAVHTGTNDVDVTIKDISPEGMKIIINEASDKKKLSAGDCIFIRGCIFNDRIGFLSSQKAYVVWKNEDELGLQFSPKLDINLDGIKEMLSSNSSLLLN